MKRYDRDRYRRKGCRLGRIRYGLAMSGAPYALLDEGDVAYTRLARTFREDVVQSHGVTRTHYPALDPRRRMKGRALARRASRANRERCRDERPGWRASLNTARPSRSAQRMMERDRMGCNPAISASKLPHARHARSPTCCPVSATR